MYWPVYTDGSDMDGFLFLLLVLYTVIYDPLFALPHRHSFKYICCLKCDKGLFVKANCPFSSISRVCVICADGTLMDHSKCSTECIRCKQCDTGAGLIVKEECTWTSNTVCGCKDGLYCLNQDCDACQEHTQCQPGQYVKEPGTGHSDRVCEDCPAGHFSNETNSDLCFPWKRCSESFYLLQEGTSTTDSICKENRRHFGTRISVFVLLITVIAAIFISTRKLFKNSPKQRTNASEEEPSYPLPKQEEGVEVYFQTEKSSLI